MSKKYNLVPDPIVHGNWIHDKPYILELASQAKNEIAKNDGDIYDCAYDNIKLYLNFSFCPKMKSHNKVLNITNEPLQI